MVNEGARAYRQLNVSTSVEDASPHELIVMMFDGALTRLSRAKGCLEHGDIEGRAQALDSVLAIVAGLQASLDQARGGALAENLDALYDYMQRRLFRAIADQDGVAIDEVADLLRTLKEAWSAIEADALVSGHEAAQV